MDNVYHLESKYGIIATRGMTKRVINTLSEVELLISPRVFKVYLVNH